MVAVTNRSSRPSACGDPARHRFRKPRRRHETVFRHGRTKTRTTRPQRVSPSAWTSESHTAVSTTDRQLCGEALTDTGKRRQPLLKLRRIGGPQLGEFGVIPSDAANRSAGLLDEETRWLAGVRADPRHHVLAVRGILTSTGHKASYDVRLPPARRNLRMPRRSRRR